MKQLILALQFMTRLPLPAVRADAHDLANAMRFFPCAGIVVGGAVWAATGIGQAVDPWVGALLGVIAWAAMTGGLHLDGLGDVADATGAGHRDRSRISAVMADPHIGSFGVIAIALAVMAKLVLLAAVIRNAHGWALPAICTAARVGPLVWALMLPPLHDGLGTRFAAAMRWHHVGIWAAVAAACAYWLPALALAIPAIWLWAAWVRSRLGGISGDSHGAGIEIVEAVLLLAVAALS